jgi:predicted amidohydrolase
VKIAAIQHDIVWEDAEATHKHVAPLIAQAAGQGARLIVLSEMFATGFSMQPERIAEPEGGVSEQFLLAQAQIHDAYLLASIAQRGVDGLFRNNAVLAASDGTVAARYAKIHPFSHARENEHYAAGTDLCTVDIDGLRVSLFICYDLRFADEFWALARETDVYVIPANWPEARSEHWKALLRARAIENQAYVVGVNRVGEDGKGYPHSGDSVILDPLGSAVAAASGNAEQVLVADISAETVAATRTRYPFLADRR